MRLLRHYWTKREEENLKVGLREKYRICRRMLSLPPTGLSVPLYPWVFWNLWTSRNKLLFEDKSFAGKEIVGKAINEARTWQNAQKPLAFSHNVSSRLPPPSPLSPLAIKCYTDASWIASKIIKDSNDSPVGHGSSHRTLIGSALVAEALAVKAGLLAALNAGHQELKCFSDSKVLVTLLAKKEWTVEIHGILHDIFLLTLSFASISFSLIPRWENVLADKLAKSTCSHYLVAPVGV